MKLQGWNLTIGIGLTLSICDALLLGVVVFAGLTFYADYRDVGEALSNFRWELLPLILVLTSMNYVFRFVKWEYYLRIIGVKGLARRDSFLIFFSGLRMVIREVFEGFRSEFLYRMCGLAVEFTTT